MASAQRGQLAVVAEDDVADRRMAPPIASCC